MAKFIKFTNVKPLNIVGNTFNEVDEIIISTDQITSITNTNGEYWLNTKVYLIENADTDNQMKISPYTQPAIISKDDYEKAKKILLEV